MRIRIVVTGRGYDTAGDLPEEIEIPGGATVADALHTLAAHLPAGESLPPSCLVAVSGAHVGTIASYSDRELQNGDELLLVAPVAGG